MYIHIRIYSTYILCYIWLTIFCGFYTDRATLKILDVSNNQIGDSGMLVIAEALKDSSTITMLGLDQCGLSVKSKLNCIQIVHMLMYVHMKFTKAKCF